RPGQPPQPPLPRQPGQPQPFGRPRQLRTQPLSIQPLQPLSVQPLHPPQPLFGVRAVPQLPTVPAPGQNPFTPYQFTPYQFTPYQFTPYRAPRMPVAPPAHGPVIVAPPAPEAPAVPAA